MVKNKCGIMLQSGATPCHMLALGQRRPSHQCRVFGCRSSGTFNAVGRKSKRRPDRQKLIIILVGLPGRGKTFLCNKLICYLNWYAPGHA